MGILALIAVLLIAVAWLVSWTVQDIATRVLDRRIRKRGGHGSYDGN